jgi:hypothetical protein
MMEGVGSGASDVTHDWIYGIRAPKAPSFNPPITLATQTANRRNRFIKGSQTLGSFSITSRLLTGLDDRLLSRSSCSAEKAVAPVGKL